MKKLLLLLLFAAPAQAATITFAWDASDTVGTTANPIKYRLYVCQNAQFTGCAMTDAGTTLTAQTDIAARQSNQL